MEKGKIVSLTDKGFGFIKKEGGSDEDKDLFFHSNELVEVDYDSLKEGDELTFEVEDGPKGLCAVNVQKA